MSLQQIFDRFAEHVPVSVMTRMTLENVLSPDRMDAIFQQYAVRQRVGDLLFSTVADLMVSVVCRVHPTINSAYRAKQVEVTPKSVYDKLAGIEPVVSRGMVRDTAEQMEKIMAAMGGARREVLRGFRVKYLDGNHLRRTDRRIEALREINAAPLPGQALVVLDPQWMLITDVIPCEDAHAQERSLVPQILETVQPGDLLISDRNYCTAPFTFGIAERQGYFIVREHAASPRRELVGRRRKVGRIATGIVYEQKMRIWHGDGREQMVRRVTVVLDEPTRDGETEIHMLTNLPKKITALKVAELYGTRWTIETAFQELAENLNNEIQTLGYPKAALFGFCMGLVAYNVLSVVKAAFRSAHGEEAAAKLSSYYMGNEIARAYGGLMITIPEFYWTKHFANLTPRQIARLLVHIASNVPLSRYAKNPWRPKKKVGKPASKKKRNHVSTARVLEEWRRTANKV